MSQGHGLHELRVNHAVEYYDWLQRTGGPSVATSVNPVRLYGSSMNVLSSATRFSDAAAAYTACADGHVSALQGGTLSYGKAVHGKAVHMMAGRPNKA